MDELAFGIGSFLLVFGVIMCLPWVKTKLFPVKVEWTAPVQATVVDVIRRKHVDHSRLHDYTIPTFYTWNPVLQYGKHQVESKESLRGEEEAMSSIGKEVTLRFNKDDLSQFYVVEWHDGEPTVGNVGWSLLACIGGIFMAFGVLMMLL